MPCKLNSLVAQSELDLTCLSMSIAMVLML
jgi:hypothetical protein